MKRRGISLPEVLLAAALIAVVGGALFSGLGTLTRQSSRAGERLWQTQEALLLMETIHRELSGLVLNALPDPRRHEGNAFLISQPNRTSIQFVTLVHGPSGPERRLVYYEARSAPPGTKSALALRKQVWNFTHAGDWTQAITFPPGWPAGWVGQSVETEEGRWKRLGVEDMRWQALLPQSGEPELFIRVKLVLRDSEGGGLLPFTTLVGVPLPEPTAEVSDCPCLNLPCFDPKKPDCSCCQAM